MIVSYYLPRVGLLTTTLHKEAAELFDFLQEEGEIERLKTLDHLGIIRRATEGAHHPRWETMVLIFKLIDLVKSHAHRAHLSTGVEISDSLEISSGTECLKVWTLLVNIGHLPLTFTAEKAFLHELKSRSGSKWPAMKKQMISTFPRSPVKRFVRRVLENEMVYSLYQAITAWRLQRWVKEGKAPQAWMDALQRLLVPETGTSKTRDLVRLYRKLRMLAYLIIDPAYTPALVSIDVQGIFTNPSVLADVLFESEQEYARIFEAIQEHLYETVYLAPKVALHSSAVIPMIREQIHKSGADGVTITLSRLLTGELQKCPIIDPRNLEHLLRLSFKVPTSLSHELFPEARPLSEEEAWIAQLGADRQYIRVSVWTLADNRNRVLDVFVYRGAPFAVRLKVFAIAMQMLARYYKRSWVSGLAHEWLQTTVYSTLTLSLIGSILKELFSTVHRWEFVPHRLQKRKLAVFAPRKSAAIGHVKSAAERIESDDAIRCSELASVLKSFTMEKVEGALYAVLLSAATGYDETGRTLIELDGIYVQQYGKRLEVVIVEAKDHAKGGKAAALKQLEGTIEKLAVSANWDVSLEVYPRSHVGAIKSPAFSRGRFAAK